MEYNEKKALTVLSMVGSVMCGICLVVGILQFFGNKIHETYFIAKYIGVLINVVLFFGFVYLIFNPTNFWVYSIIFYIYGTGNLYDNGHMLGIFCLTISCAFLYRLGFFNKKRILKLILMSILPAGGLAFQWYNNGIVLFLISFLHVVAFILLTGTLFIVLFPVIKEHLEKDRTTLLDSRKVTPQDVEWLERVLNGEKYSAISKDYDVSESKIKARMIELYKILNVHDKTEFLTTYNNHIFTLIKPEDNISEN